jgi:hypothetical protein
MSRKEGPKRTFGRLLLARLIGLCSPGLHNFNAHVGPNVNYRSVSAYSLIFLI